MTENNVSTKLLEKRQYDDAYQRMVRVQEAMHLWRLSLVSEMAALDAHNDGDMDLLHGELQECGLLINAVHEASVRGLGRLVKAQQSPVLVS